MRVCRYLVNGPDAPFTALTCSKPHASMLGECVGKRLLEQVAVDSSGQSGIAEHTSDKLPTYRGQPSEVASEYPRLSACCTVSSSWNSQLISALDLALYWEWIRPSN